jgi:hypothetical protein
MCGGISCACKRANQHTAASPAAAAAWAAAGWPGVVCCANASGLARVCELQLAGQNLTGPIPALGELSSRARAHPFSSQKPLSVSDTLALAPLMLQAGSLGSRHCASWTSLRTASPGLFRQAWAARSCWSCTLPETSSQVCDCPSSRRLALCGAQCIRCGSSNTPTCSCTCPPTHHRQFTAWTAGPVHQLTSTAGAGRVGQQGPAR